MLVFPPDGGIGSGREGRFGRCAPVCTLAVCSSVCSAWSRSFTSSSRASCSRLLLRFSFFRRFWMSTEQEKKGRKTPPGDQPLLTDIYFISAFDSIVLTVCLLLVCVRSLPRLPDLPRIFTSGRTAEALKALWDWNVCCALEGSTQGDMIKSLPVSVSHHYYYFCKVYFHHCSVRCRSFILEQAAHRFCVRAKLNLAECAAEIGANHPCRCFEG